MKAVLFVHISFQGLETTDNQKTSSGFDYTIEDEWLEPPNSSPIDTDDYNQILFIDSEVPDSQTLIDNISGATDVVVLDEDEDEIVQISEHLENYQQLDAVHIVSLGESGQLTFANTVLDFDTLTQYDNLLRSWRDSLTEEADIVLYGCDVSYGEAGNSFVQQLSQTTNADINASVDKTGASGNWILETPVGQIETDSIFNPTIATEYQYTLDTTVPDAVRLELNADFTGSTSYFGTDISQNGFDFNQVDANDLTLLSGVDIDGNGEAFSYSDLNSDNIAEIDYQNVSASDLQILTTEEGLSFEELEAEDFAELDINTIPTENLAIIDNAGLDLTSYDAEILSDVRLGVVANFGYIDEAVFNTNSLSPDTTFGELSNTVVANANLYDYKNENLNLEDGFSLSETELLDFNDYKALDFAFDGDFIFDSSYYLEQNPDVADNGVNPFTQYFTSGAYPPEIRDPTPYFDSSYYLENNFDVADNGVNPLLQYFSSGAYSPEFRDPDPAFDTSFYLKEYPEVAEDGVNPLLQYFNTGAGEGRYANAVFKYLEETGQALLTSLDIDGEDFEDFKETALSLIETRQDVETAAVALPIIPILVKIGEVILATYITKKAIETSGDIRELLQQNNDFEGSNADGGSNIFIFPNDSRLTQEGEILTFPEGEFDVDFGTPPLDIGEPIGFDDNTFFPKGESGSFLDDILNGRFEFPLEGEGGSYFLAIEENNEIIRELRNTSTFLQKTSSGMREYNASGGFEEANEIFDSLELSNVKNQLTNSRAKGRIGELDDGRRVVVRNLSKGKVAGEDGPPTIEIQNNRGKSKDKFRFPD